MTQPTVGRVVWFWPYVTEQLALPRAGQPLAAHVAAVSEDGRTVNLQVVDANGHAHARQGVPFCEGGRLEGESYADWMPYQRAKQEEGVIAQESVGKTIADFIAGRQDFAYEGQAPAAPAIPWHAAGHLLGAGGVIDTAKVDDSVRPVEAAPAEDPAKADAATSSDDASAS